MNRKEKTSSRSAGWVDPDLKTDDHDKIMIWLDSIIEGIVKKKGDDYFVKNKVWELPVSAKNGFLCGYIDMAIEIQKTRKETEIEVERRISDANRYKRLGCAGIPDSDFCEEKQDVNIHYADVFFEVKSRISNVGECIRQIRQYQHYVSEDVKFVVVCPDDKFKHIIEGQGIGFLHCDGVA